MTSNTYVLAGALGKTWEPGDQVVLSRLVALTAASNATGTPVAGRTPQQVMADLGAQGVCVWAGDDYAVELMRSLGLADSGGAVCAGVVCYTTAQEVDRLLACL